VTDAPPEIRRETYLRRALRDPRDGYDLVLIDCPPNLGLLTVNALCAADEAVVPIDMKSVDALAGAEELVATAAALEEDGPRVSALVRNRVEALRGIGARCTRRSTRRSPNSTCRYVARYHAHLAAGGRSSATVKKERAALNTFLRWLAEHEHVPAAQVREALAVCLPRAERAEREAPKALTAAQYDRLVREAQARIADDPLAGTRDLAIVLVLGDAGLRGEELARLERRGFLPARKGALLRALDVRHGKGDRRRRVKLSARAARAVVRWDRERARALGAPGDDAPLFVTLGTRRRDDTDTRGGAPCRQGALADLLKRLGAAAELPCELRHPHALRHTCATELLRAGAMLADVRAFLGHASVHTTSIYLASSEQRQEALVRRREHGRPTLDEDRDAA
jgi:site-specific recombinase XerD